MNNAESDTCLFAFQRLIIFLFGIHLVEMLIFGSHKSILVEFR